MTRQPANGPGSWVLLSYRMPREPSTPRITIWRKLKRLGVAQLGDGLIALPADARTRSGSARRRSTTEPESCVRTALSRSRDAVLRPIFIG